MRKVLIALVAAVALVGSATSGSASVQAPTGSAPTAVCSACW